ELNWMVNLNGGGRGEWVGLTKFLRDRGVLPSKTELSALCRWPTAPFCSRPASDHGTDLKLFGSRRIIRRFRASPLLSTCTRKIGRRLTPRRPTPPCTLNDPCLLCCGPVTRPKLRGHACGRR